MAQVDRSPLGLSPSDSFLAFCKAGQWQQALVFLPSVRSVRGLQPACSHLLASLARQSKWQEAQSFFRALPTHLHTPGILSAFLSSYAQKRFWQHSLSVLHSQLLAQAALDAAVHNTVITSCARASRWPWSLWLLTELSESPKSRANLLTFNAAIHACERRGLWVQALLLLQQMQNVKITPDSTSLNCILSACEKGQQWEGAIAFLPCFSTHGCQRTMVTYGAIAAACVAGLAWEAAIAALLEFRQHAPEVPTVELLNSTMESCKRAWAWRQCLWLLKNSEVKSRIQEAATEESLTSAQVPGMNLQVVPIPAALQTFQLSKQNFEWTVSGPTISDHWLREANNFDTSFFIRHSLELRNGFAQPGGKKDGFPPVFGRSFLALEYLQFLRFQSVTIAAYRMS